MNAHLAYQSGFGNEFATEAVPGALPRHRNSPQRAPMGLYAEQLTATAFTAPRAHNRRSWLYRIRPAATHGRFESMPTPAGVATDLGPPPPPNPLRWSPQALPTRPVDFVEAWDTMALNAACAIHRYAANRDMVDRYFYNADGEMLIVPQQGRLRLATELGVLELEPQEIAVIPRGVRIQVTLPDGAARGYLCENFGALLRLPDLGPIGANGLANPRDFLTPCAAYEDRSGDFELWAKFGGHYWRAPIDHSPLDVVAWHGNDAPYKYDLRHFNTLGSISYDHPDPSIFLVLHAPTATPGVDGLDFVIFPPRWLAGEDTFRPPWFHRNVASEFMGLITGQYDAKAEGFQPGGASLHNCMSGHGPDRHSFEAASRADTRTPHKVDHTMAFMFETIELLRPTAQALASPLRQADYDHCWLDFPRTFTPPRP